MGASRGPLESSWGASGAPWRPMGATLAPLCISWPLNPLHRRHICELLGVSGGVLASLLGVFGMPWELLGDPWGVLRGVFATPWGSFGKHLLTLWLHFLASSIRCTGVEFASFWGFLADLWGPLWTPFVTSWVNWSTAWEHFGTMLGDFGVQRVVSALLWVLFCIFLLPYVCF